MLKAMRNIYASQNASGTRSATEPRSPDQVDRVALDEELLEELTAWSPRERHGVFQAWHRHALSLVHLNVLTVLEAEGPLAMKSLAEALDVSDASVTGIVDRMEKRGLVERRHCTEDRRQVMVHVTDAGTQVFQNMEAHRREFQRRVVGELNEHELVAVLRAMRAIRAARGRALASLECEHAANRTGEAE